ncbi:hypothetical protein LUZ60_005260 [Juncus effusus]|nr:hypothetical protein LUZ60_005260 [Juncus effusus]
MGTPEFPNLGKHCSVEDCKQIDFLPFTCDRCKEVFCLQHRNYTTHQCPIANPNDVTVIICPLCAKSVRLVPNQDPNITWESHVNTDCDPSNYQKATKKKRCPVQGCKETLTFSNTIKCKDCTKDHCLKHRFGPDHKCPGPRKPDPGFLGMLRRSQTNNNNYNNKYSNSNKNSASSSSWWSSSLSSIKASAEAGMQKLSIATNDVFNNNNNNNNSSSSNYNNNMNGGNVDICPKCKKGFRDPVLLVEHVERDHGGTSRA